MVLDYRFSVGYSSNIAKESSLRIKMNKRQESLLKYLINSQEYEPVELIADHLTVSSKTIRRDLAVIDELISRYDAKVDVKRGKGVRLFSSTEAKEKLSQEFSQTRLLYQDRRERNLLQSFFILLSAIGHIPVKTFANHFYISHRQLFADLKAIKEIFDPYHLSITIDKEGVWVNGDEKDIYDLLVFLFSQYRDYGYPQQNIIYPVEIKKATLVTKSLINMRDMEFIERVMHIIENFSSSKIWKQDYAIIFISLFVLIKRKLIFGTISLSPVMQEKNVDKETDLVRIIRDEIEREYSLSLNEGDIQKIINIFLATGLVHDPTFSKSTLSPSNRQQLIYNFSEDFVDAFATITDIDLRANASFYLRVRDHIEPMINRVLINLGIADRHLETYAQEYKSTMNVCEVICWILSRKYGLPEIPRAEVLFLMLYIQTEIIEAESKLKVGLLTNDEKSIVNLQLARLAKEFPSWEIIQYQQLSKSEFFKDSLDFVIANKGNLIDTGIPHVEISQKMSELDLHLIKASVFNLTSNSIRELSKLQNIFRDLLDLGCLIYFNHDQPDQVNKNRQTLRIDGVGNSVFHYFDKGEGENTLYVRCPDNPNGNFQFTFDMNNWDFLLFASKIVFLVDRTNSETLCGSIEKIACHLKENNV